MPPARPSRARRIVMPLIILVIGGAIAWWAAQRETGEISTVRQYVREICLAAGQGADVTSRLAVDNRSLLRPLAHLVQIACAPLGDNPEGLEIDVTTEPTGGIDRGRAIHTARIEVHELHVLTLRLVVVNERAIITGYEQPEPPG